jgi:hypothetical protein
MKSYLKKNPAQKRAGGVAQSVGSEFKPQHHERKKCASVGRSGDCPSNGDIHGEKCFQAGNNLNVKYEVQKRREELYGKADKARP